MEIVPAAGALVMADAAYLSARLAYWCGSGGAGPPVNAPDQACQQHDPSYDRVGFTASSSYNPGRFFGRQLQECNQRLCDASGGQGAQGGIVKIYFSLVPIGTCRTDPRASLGPQ